MFTPEVVTYEIDLNLPEADRWAKVIAAEKQTAIKLVRSAEAMFKRVPTIARWTLDKLYKLTGGLYHDEIKSWAKAIDVPVGTVTLLNCAYELSHLRVPKFFGCTAGICKIDGLGMIHVRTLDWPIAGMGEATRIFRFRRGSREAVAVSFPGQVGVLSGMVPGAYSVTINWAPPGGFPTFEFGPTFLLRDVLENCDTYADAVNRLCVTRLSTSVFFTVCGTKDGQACVIERSPTDAVVRPFDGGPLVQANHHLAEPFVKNNEDIREMPPEEEVFSIAGSQKRMDLLQNELSTIKQPVAVESLLNLLAKPTVTNRDTCHKILLVPTKGEIMVQRRISD